MYKVLHTQRNMVILAIYFFNKRQKIIAPELVSYSAPRDLHRRAAYSICEPWFLIHQDVYHDLFVCS